MQSSNKVTINDFSLVILRNHSLLESVRDYFYQMLLHDFDEDKIFITNKNNLRWLLGRKLKTTYAVVIEEGILFNKKIEDIITSSLNDIEQYSLIGHLLDRKNRYYHLHPQHFIINASHWKQIDCPDFTKKANNNLIDIERSTENFHDDYTPLWIRKNSNKTIKCENLKFGGFVISEMLKNNLLIRPFQEDERHTKQFVYYSDNEQVRELLKYENLSANSYYYPLTTGHRKQQFTNLYSNYVSVANGIESLIRIKNVYQKIKKITFYDISITALMFTELLIKNYLEDYKSFVIEFNKLCTKQPWALINDINDLDSYTDAVDVLPILKHLRNNDVDIEYKIGDITRSSILENLKTDTLINLTNVFDYQHNLIRKDEWDFWLKKTKSISIKTEILR